MQNYLSGKLGKRQIIFQHRAYPIVVMKLVVKEPSENRSRRQLLPTPMYRERKGSGN
jgi:hypothetical protein